ncbi:MAG: hypothetical protein FJW91_01560 [Actinobacteria bacterium]|nr:hypothetical protein [Actinomycetota bacterium]
MRKIMVDTDIGSDVDDAMVLTALPTFTDLKVLGITCVYGDVELRGKIALSYTGGRYPVFKGESLPLYGSEPWHSGIEGFQLEGLNSFAAADGAIEFLLSEVNEHPGEIEILAIGPLTNIATAIKRDPSWSSKVKALYVMGGDFARDFAEHNFKCDSLAAQIVFGADMRIWVMPLNVTRQVSIEIGDFDFLGDSALGKEIRQWATYRNVDFNNPHDLIALLMALEPDLFDFSGLGQVTVSEGGKCSHAELERGRHKIVSDLDELAVRERVLQVLRK